jgi:2'-5' RNA ligase
MSVRSFVAIELGDALRRDLASLRVRLGLERAPWKWVEEVNLHLTVKFLGDVEESIVRDALARLRTACFSEEPFDMTLGGIGTFPPGRAPRVLFVGVTENAEIVKRLAARIDKELVALGIEPETKEFHPHVTLARAKQGKTDASTAGAMPRGPFGTGIGIVGRTRVTELALKASRLEPAGPVYSTIGDVPLRGAT